MALLSPHRTKETFFPLLLWFFNIVHSWSFFQCDCICMILCPKCWKCMHVFVCRCKTNYFSKSRVVQIIINPSKHNQPIECVIHSVSCVSVLMCGCVCTVFSFVSMWFPLVNSCHSFQVTNLKQHTITICLHEKSKLFSMLFSYLCIFVNYIWLDCIKLLVRTLVTKTNWILWIPNRSHSKNEISAQKNSIKTINEKYKIEATPLSNGKVIIFILTYIYKKQ